MGFLGSVVAIVMGALKSHSVELDHALLLCASSLVTASIASFVLGKYEAFICHCKVTKFNQRLQNRELYLWWKPFNSVIRGWKSYLW